MRELRLFNPWRGVVAAILVAAGAVVAVVYGIIAVVLLRDRR